MTLPKIEPMQLVQQATPFDHIDWIFEIKHDGFRALAYIEDRKCKLVSRTEYDYKRFGELMAALPPEINAKDAILDGELVVLDREGKSQFNNLMSGRGLVVFAAFDLVWLNGRDLRDLSVVERKGILLSRLRPMRRILYVNHFEGQGKALYAQICKRDMEGIVCKPAVSPYRTIRGKTSWVKVKNPRYSQAEGRAEIFNKRRS